MKKILSIFAASMLAVSSFAFDSAAEGQEYYGSQCKALGLADGTVAVTAYYFTEGSTEIWIPATIQEWDNENDVMTAEYQVSQVGYSNWGAIWVGADATNALTTATAIAIADGVKVHDGAFWGATALKTLTLDGNIVVGGWAFGSCDALTSIIFNGTSVPACGSDAFKGGAEWNTIINNCTVTVKSESAKESFNHDPWDYWTEFYTNGKVVVAEQTPTSMVEVTRDGRAHKIVRNGQIYIVRDDQLFTLTGTQVR